MYITRVEGLTTVVRYHGVAVDEETRRRILVGLPMIYISFVRDFFLGWIIPCDIYMITSFKWAIILVILGF